MTVVSINKYRESYVTSVQYIVTYKDENTLQELSSVGSITYKSPVINVLFIDSKLSENDLSSINGVMSITYPKNGRLYSNKK